jgi:histidinol-phosphate aminotransferase
MKIAILGMGNMGHFLFNVLKEENVLKVFDVNKERLAQIPVQNILQNIEEVQSEKFNMVINAVPLTKTVEVFEQIIPLLDNNCILCDIASVKGKIQDFYKQHTNPFISIHPMFGPTFADLSLLEGENAVIIKESNQFATDFFKHLFNKLKVEVFEYSFLEHDKMMAYSLSLPFISSFVFSACTTATTVPGTTFKKHQKIAQNLLAEDHRLLSEILFNPHTVNQIRTISGKIEHLKHIINGKDYEESLKFIGQLKKNIENNFVKKTITAEKKLLPVKSVLRMSPYIPGKTVDQVAVQNSITPSSIVKLSSNENPLGAPEKVVEVIKNRAESICYYPDGGSTKLKEKISEKFKIKTENIIIGNGSSEIIENVCVAFMEKNNIALISEFGFGLYKKAVLASNHNFKEVKANKLGHCLDNFLSSIDTSVKVIFIANPNNPTGTMVSFSKLKSFMEQIPQNILVVADEAYIEYSRAGEENSCLTLLKNQNFKNLLVVRTFSKVYGLAGLRVGYGFADKEIITALDKVRSPSNISILSGIACEVALDCDDFVSQSVELNNTEKTYLFENLKKLPVKAHPSFGNFILVNVFCDSANIVKKMEGKGVIVRDVSSYGLKTHIRVTVGTREQNKKFLHTLTSVLKDMKSKSFCYN